MFEVLAEEVERLSVPPDGDALVAALAIRDRLSARIAEAAGAFDMAALWDLEGATSMTAWLRSRAGMTNREAARTAGTARRLRALPVTAEAWANGALSGGQVEAIVAHLDDRRAQVFAGHEAALVPTLVGLSPADTARAMGRWRAHADALDDPTPPGEPERALHLSQTLDGRVVLDGDLDAVSGQVVTTALREAAGSDAEGDAERTPAERRADALVDICRAYLDHHHARPGARHRPHVNVVVDLHDLEAGRGGRFVGGPDIDGPSLSALTCDSALHRLLLAGPSVVLDYGTATRTISPSLWNALVVRDERCRFPGCDRPPWWCDGHHVVPVEDDGPTCLANLVLLCRRHHTRLHQPGWHAKLLPDATLEVVDPAGHVRSTTPPRVGPAP